MKGKLLLSIYVVAVVVLLYLGYFHGSLEKFAEINNSTMRVSNGRYLTVTPLVQPPEMNLDRITVNRPKTEKWPKGWGKGLHSWDVYANGAIAAGKGGNIAAYINSAGNAYVGAKLTAKDVNINGKLCMKGNDCLTSADFKKIKSPVLGKGQTGPPGKPGPAGPPGKPGPAGGGSASTANSEKVQTKKLQLGDKFLMSGVGDAHANDDWLRMFGKDGKGYYGGFAAGRLWAPDFNSIGGGNNFKGGVSRHNPHKWQSHFPWAGDNKNYIRGDTEIRGDTNNIGDMSVGGDLYVHGLKHSRNWTGYPDNATDKSEIANDTGHYKKLMIIGNKSAGAERRVGIWDRLDVHGKLVTNTLELGNKFRLSGVGDAHANDDWLRVFNTANSGYYGGVAAGRLWSATGGLSGSDKNLKENIRDVDANDKLKFDKLAPKKFDWKDSKQHSYGFIAQDIEHIYPTMVHKGPNNMKSLNYNEFVPLVVGKVQDINKQVKPDKLCIEDVCLTKKDIVALKKLSTA